MNKVTVSAPGKLMLFGEHAVVYNHPCLVTAVDQRIRLEAELLGNPNFELDAKDVDVCFILKHPDNYSEAQIKAAQLNSKSRLKIHPLYLTEKELEKKLMEKDKPVVEMVKSCVVVHGHELFVEVLKNVQS